MTGGKWTAKSFKSFLVHAGFVRNVKAGLLAEKLSIFTTVKSSWILQFYRRREFVWYCKFIYADQSLKKLSRQLLTFSKSSFLSKMFMSSHQFALIQSLSMKEILKIWAVFWNNRKWIFVKWNLWACKTSY